MCLSAPANDGVIRGYIQTDSIINTVNSGGTLLEGKVRDVGINTAIVVTSASNVGTGFVEPMEQLKLALENIVSTDHLLNRGKGTKN